MRLVRNPIIWFRRIRHRKGYGVHSPFAFQLITGVIYERTPYYAFTDLDRLHTWLERKLNLYPVQCHRLLFRLANYIHPSSFLVVAPTNHEAAYIRAALPSATITITNSLTIASHLKNGQWPAAFVGHSCLSSALTLSRTMPADGMLVVEGIHQDKTSLQLWHDLQNDPHTGITFDLYTYGICFYDLSRHKQHYIVNF